MVASALIVAGGLACYQTLVCIGCTFLLVRFRRRWVEDGRGGFRVPAGRQSVWRSTFVLLLGRLKKTSPHRQ